MIPHPRFFKILRDRLSIDLDAKFPVHPLIVRNLDGPDRSIDVYHYSGQNRGAKSNGHIEDLRAIISTLVVVSGGETVASRFSPTT